MEKKIKYDKDNLCKCGKPTPIIPYSCKKCRRGSMKGIKIEVVKLGKLKLPSGIVID